jgi:hypothetical protein
MKNWVLVAMFILSSTVFASKCVLASECIEQQAQFVGKVRNFSGYYDEMGGFGECSYQIEFSNFKPTSTCPLELTEAQHAVIGGQLSSYDSACTYGVKANDQEISGVLVRFNSGEYLIR